MQILFMMIEQEEKGREENRKERIDTTWMF